MIVEALRRAVFTRDGGRCVYCGADRVPLTLDHVVPRSRGGADTWTNLASACEGCNAAKADRDVDEFRASVPA